MKLVQIGTIHTPFLQSTGTPVQASKAHEAEGYVIVDEAYAEALRDIEGFDRIWLVYWFDRSKKAQMTVTPYKDTIEHGLFATRAPSRPNPIGFSSVSLIRREGTKLYVRDVDMLDGTPLLDIKPYVPEFDIFEVSRNGWLDNAENVNTADNRFEK